MEIKQRYVVLFVSWLSILGFFVLRTNLSVAILAMAKPIQKSNSSYTPCSKNISISIRNNTGKFDWNNEQQALLLSAFFIGYTLAQFFGGLAVSIFGPKHVLLICFFLSSLLTIFFPHIATRNFTALIIDRILLGLLSGPLLPCAQNIIGVWTPVEERSFLSSFLHSGNIIGITVAYLAGGFICDHESLKNGWACFFYLSGGLTFFIGVLWYMFVYDNPSKHPWISEKEKAYIQKSCYRKNQNIIEALRSIPFREILRSRALWTCTSALFGHMFIFFAILAGHAKFLKDVFAFSTRDASLLSMIPFIFYLIVQIFYPILIDYLRIKKGINVTVLRKVSSGIAYIGACSFIFPIGFFGCDQYIYVIIFMSIALAFMGCNVSGFFTAAVEIAPQYAGIIMGIANTFGSTSGFISLLVSGYFLKSGDRLIGWRYTFIFISVCSLISGLVFVFFGTSELQPWAQNKVTISASNDETISLLEK